MMSGAMTYLAWTAVLTALIWIPYTLNMIMVRGLIDAVGYPADPKPLAPWAQRMKKAHYNAVENLVVFAVLVLVAHTTGASDSIIDMAALIYFWTRVAHIVVFTVGIPWVRTLSFVAGSVCQIVIGWQILS